VPEEAAACPAVQAKADPTPFSALGEAALHHGSMAPQGPSPPRSLTKKPPMDCHPSLDGAQSHDPVQAGSHPPPGRACGLCPLAAIAPLLAEHP
jgi:hypothetical protein